MGLLTKSDLLHKYNWKADGGDDPTFRVARTKRYLIEARAMKSLISSTSYRMNGNSP